MEKIDLVGQKFGRLLVVKEIEPRIFVGKDRVRKLRQYLCRCDCGNEINVLMCNLRNGTTNSCGCLHKEVTREKFHKDLIGKRFGRLYVDSICEAVQSYGENGKKDGFKYKYNCVCDCGNTTEVYSGDLLNGSTISCGCYRKEQIKKRYYYQKDDKINIYNSKRELVKYFKNIEDTYHYSCSSEHESIFVCPSCGREKKMTIKDFNSNGLACPYCRNSLPYGEKFIVFLLEELNVDFEREKSFDWLRRKFYDFYIPSQNCIIEVNGAQHYIETKLWGKLEDIQKNDKLKYTQAINNGINKYIILDCCKSELNYFKNSILNSELNNIFDLSNVDWLKIDDCARDGFTLKIIEEYNNGKTVQEIQNHLGVSNNIVTSCLHIGSENNLCNYGRKSDDRKI